MKICLLVLWGDSLTYTLAKAMAFNGHEVYVWVADVERHNRASWGTPQRIAAIPGVSVFTDEAAKLPEQIDQLIVQGHPLLLQHKNVLNQIAPRASQLTLISSGDRSRGYWSALSLQLREWRWIGRWFAKFDRVAYKDGFYPVDLHGLFRSRRVVGFDAHSKFLQDEVLFKAIHSRDWGSDKFRPIRVNFLGSRDPAIRGKVLNEVEPYFIAASPNLEQSKQMLWHAYTDAQPASLSPEEFLNSLTISDFTLSPPGYSLVTHRPVEALLRGSIPVLNAEELDLYDLGLEDGVNCIAVPPGGWPAAMERITQMDEGKIVAMRRNIQGMLTDRVEYPALSRDMNQRLGLKSSVLGP